MFAVSRIRLAAVALLAAAIAVTGCSSGNNNTVPSPSQPTQQVDVCPNMPGVQPAVPTGSVEIQYEQDVDINSIEEPIVYECITKAELVKRKAKVVEQRKAAKIKFANYLRQLVPLKPGLPQMRVAVDYFCKSATERDAYYNKFSTSSYYQAGWSFVDDSWPKEFDRKVGKVCEETANMAWGYDGVELHTELAQ